MTEALLESTDIVYADSLALSSMILVGEQYRAVSAIGSMGEIPSQELCNYISCSRPESTLNQREYISLKTAPLTGESQLPKFLPAQSARILDRFIPLQKWEGVVLAVEPEIFRARLVDLTNRNPAEEVELPLEEVSDSDMVLVRPGGLFYWTIGYLDDRFGQRQRASRIRFRRVPEWTTAELESARQEADALADRLGWK